MNSNIIILIAVVISLHASYVMAEPTPVQQLLALGSLNGFSVNSFGVVAVKLGITTLDDAASSRRLSGGDAVHTANSFPFSGRRLKEFLNTVVDLHLPNQQRKLHGESHEKTEECTPPSTIFSQILLSYKLDPETNLMSQAIFLSDGLPSLAVEIVIKECKVNVSSQSKQTNSMINMKIMAIFVTFALACIGVILPIAVPCIRRSKRILSWLMCFGCGVFLSVAFTHILSESISGLACYYPNYPVAGLIMMGTVVFICFIESIVLPFVLGVSVLPNQSGYNDSNVAEVVIAFDEKHLPRVLDNICVQDHEDSKTSISEVISENDIRLANFENMTNDANENMTVATSDIASSVANTNPSTSNFNINNTNDINSQKDETSPDPDISANIVMNSTIILGKNMTTYTPNSNSLPSNNNNSNNRDSHTCDEPTPVFIHGGILTDRSDNKQLYGRSHGHSHGDDRVLVTDIHMFNWTTPIFLFIALGSHAFFEGLGLGVQNTEGDFWTLFAAVCSHKFCEGVAIGVSCVRSTLTISMQIIVCLIFSLSLPIGLSIGTGISTTISPLGESVITSMVTGTFLYIALVEILPSEFANPQDCIIKFIFLCVGSTAIALVGLRHGSFGGC